MGLAIATSLKARNLKGASLAAAPMGALSSPLLLLLLLVARAAANGLYGLPMPSLSPPSLRTLEDEAVCAWVALAVCGTPRLLVFLLLLLLPEAEARPGVAVEAAGGGGTGARKERSGLQPSPCKWMCAGQ